MMKKDINENGVKYEEYIPEPKTDDEIDWRMIKHIEDEHGEHWYETYSKGCYTDSSCSWTNAVLFPIGWLSLWTASVWFAYFDRIIQTPWLCVLACFLVFECLVGNLIDYKEAPHTFSNLGMHIIGIVLRTVVLVTLMNFGTVDETNPIALPVVAIAYFAFCLITAICSFVRFKF